MAKLNYDRPHLKIVDNLRRVLAASDSCYKSNVLEQKPDDGKAISTMSKQRSPGKKSVQIEFQGNELDLCQAFLDAIELYYSDFEIFLKGFMSKSKNKARSKSKLEESETNLRTCIREFFAEYMIVKIKQNKESGLPVFWKLLEKELKKSGCAYDIIIDEFERLGESIESGLLDHRLSDLV
jgi:hypothetical protein